MNENPAENEFEIYIYIHRQTDRQIDMHAHVSTLRFRTWINADALCSHKSSQ